MIVWRDTSGKNKPRRPSWFDDNTPMARAETETQGCLWTAEHYAAQLCWREDVQWHDAGNDWEVAQYLPFEPQWYMRQLDGCLWQTVKDVDGCVWHVPALIRPDGTPAIGMKNRATIIDGEMVWHRDAPTATLVRALEAAQELRPHCLANFDTLESQEQLLHGCLAMLEAAYCINAQSFALLGLVGDVVLCQGTKQACGVLDLDEMAA